MLNQSVILMLLSGKCIVVKGHACNGLANEILVIPVQPFSIFRVARAVLV